MAINIQPPRTPWGNFPDVVIHASESAVKQHPAYKAAKAGDGVAAMALICDTMNAECNREPAQRLAGQAPTLVSAHAYERNAENAIPEVFADLLSQALNWLVDHGIYQANVVFHTGADGFSRLARQARFGGHPLKRSRTTPATRPAVGSNENLVSSILRGFEIKNSGRLWSLWAKGCAVVNSKSCPRQAPRCAKRIVHKLHSLFSGES